MTLTFKIGIETYADENEAKRFLFSRPIDREVHAVGEVDQKEISEVRPDWGVYHAIPTITKLERYLRLNNKLPIVESHQRVTLSIEGQK